MHMSPFGLRLLIPVTKRLQAELEHPLGLPFLGRDEPDDILVQPLFYDFCMYVGRKAELVFLFGDTAYESVIVFSHI